MSNEKRKNSAKLLVSPTSPYARKPRFIAIYRNIDEDNLEIVECNPWAKLAGMLDHNPLNKVPVFISESDEYFYDSKVIVELVNYLPGGSSVLPEEFMQRQRVHSIASFIDDVLRAIVEPVMYKKVSSNSGDGKWLDWNMEKVERCLVHLEKIVPKSDDAEKLATSYLIGNQLSLADINLLILLDYMLLRLPEHDWQGMHPHLHAWFLQHKKTPAFVETTPH